MNYSDYQKDKSKLRNIYKDIELSIPDDFVPVPGSKIFWKHKNGKEGHITMRLADSDAAFKYRAADICLHNHTDCADRVYAFERIAGIIARKVIKKIKYETLAQIAIRNIVEELDVDEYIIFCFIKRQNGKRLDEADKELIKNFLENECERCRECIR